MVQSFHFIFHMLPAKNPKPTVNVDTLCISKETAEASRTFQNLVKEVLKRNSNIMLTAFYTSQSLLQNPVEATFENSYIYEPYMRTHKIESKSALSRRARPLAARLMQLTSAMATAGTIGGFGFAV